jgi:hypothetical protein
MTRPSLIGIFVLGLLLALQACSFTTANIEKVVLARTVDAETKEPLDETKSFNGADAILHCTVQMANTPSGTLLKARWYAVLENAQEVLDTTEIELERSGWVDFSLELTQNSLPYGNYAVDLFIDGKFDRTLPFIIEPAFPDGIVKEAVTSLALSDSYFPTTPTTVFPAATPTIYAPIYVSEQPAGTVFAANWYQHLDGGDRAPITSSEIAFDDEGWIGFTLNLTEGLPVGNYSVDILVDGEVVHTLEFGAQ